jgi:hypothetical protein
MESAARQPPARECDIDRLFLKESASFFPLEERKLFIY